MTIAQSSIRVRDDDTDDCPDLWFYARAGDVGAYLRVMAQRFRLRRPAHPLVYLSCAPKLREALDLDAVHRHADPDALALAREVADRRAAASARPVRRGTTRDPDRLDPRDLWRPVAPTLAEGEL